MLYPTISDYISSICTPEDFDQLTDLEPVLDSNNHPILSSGNFAVVFKMRNKKTGKLHALKCFLKDQPNRCESYRLIADELEFVSSTFLTPIRFLEKEIFVDSAATTETEFPVLLMDWIEGVPLDRYVREHISDSNALALLAYQFSRMSAWLLSQPFAHGDMKPDNILVTPEGNLVLVDYDGMYVPKMAGQKARETGTPDFRHPSRTPDSTFDEHIDDFAVASILLSLRALAFNPSWFSSYGANDRLLLSDADYRDPGHSAFLRNEFPSGDPELDKCFALFLLALSRGDLSHVSFRLLNLDRPERIPVEELLSTKVTAEDRKAGVSDEFGVLYSPDGKRLLEWTKGYITNYTVKSGCKVICDDAFSGCDSLRSISLPNSLTSIGINPFRGLFLRISCSSPHFSVGDDGALYDKNKTTLIYVPSGVTSFSLPDSVTSIGNHAFLDCSSLHSISLPDSVTSIGDYAFSYCSSLKSISLPDSLTSIGDYAFWDCSSLQSISLPNSLSSIGINPFRGLSLRISCSSPHFSVDGVGALYDKNKTTLIYVPSDVTSFSVPASVTSIGDSAFSYCESLQSISLPDTLSSIGDSAFMYCSSLQSISLPDTLSSIGNSAFGGCSSLQSISLPDSLTSIGNAAFSSCKSLQSISLPNSLTLIGDAFIGCESLQYISLPNSLTSIGNHAFYNCKSLQSISLPDSVTSIGNYAFYYCESLQSISLPDSLTSINGNPFIGCSLRISCSSPHFSVGDDGALYDKNKTTLIYVPSDVTSFSVPASVTSIGDYAFSSCSSLKSIFLPDSLTSIGDSAFYMCQSLQSISLPDTLSSIGDSAFSSCYSLKSISLPDSLTSIGDSAFYECDSLPQEIEDRIRLLNSRAFDWL
ncbi:MAG: leucine-rich repeat protein [Bacteroidales bacterium]|nr:leucine-rich repeat protein [Bacteroidales bacterium]